MSDTVLTCKSCIHSRISAFSKYGSYLFNWSAPKEFHYKCAKALEPAHEIVDPVIGHFRVPATMPYCSIERGYSSSDCGPDAKNWSPKNKKDLFKMLTKEHE